MEKMKLIAAIMIIGLISCKKDEKYLNGTTGIKSNRAGTVAIPVNNGSQLEFTDLTHFLDWQDYLDVEVDNPLNTDIDSLLAVVEFNDLGNFYSLRQEILVRNGLDDPTAEFFSEEIDAMFACDFVIDDVLKSCLNKDHEVRIGDSIYIYFSENILLAIHHSNTSDLTKLRDVEKCDDKIEISLLNPSITVISGTNRTVGGPSGLCTHTIFVKEGSDSLKYKYHYYPYWGSENVDCEVYKKKFVYTIRYNKYLDASETTSGYDSLVKEFEFVDIQSVSINFGDGNSAPLSATSSKIYTGFHTYSVLGTYFAKGTSTFKDELDSTHTFSGDICDEETVYVRDQVCAFFNSHEQGSEENNGWKMSYNIWVKVKTIKYSQLGCWTRAWKQKSNGKWRHKRTMMQAYSKGVFRDDNCFIKVNPESINKNRSRRKMTAKSKKHRRPYKYDIANGECFSIHALSNRGISHIKVLTPCD